MSEAPQVRLRSNTADFSIDQSFEEDERQSIDASSEPLVEHFEAKLMTSPRHLQRENSLPGLGVDGPTVPPRGASHRHTTSQDNGKTRQLKSVVNQ